MKFMALLGKPNSSKHLSKKGWDTDGKAARKSKRTRAPCSDVSEMVMADQSTSMML